MVAENSASSGSNQSVVSNSRKFTADLISSVRRAQVRADVPQFRSGDSLRVHAKIVEGNKERVQVFEGVVIRRKGRNGPSATFTVRKVSYNVGVERTFLLHSPRIEKIEVLTAGEVRRGKLYYLRDIRGKASRIKARLLGLGDSQATGSDAVTSEASAG